MNTDLKPEEAVNVGFGSRTDVRPVCAMSALPLKADICSALAHVCFGPKADIAITLLQIQPAHCTPFLSAQTSNGTSSLDPVGNANTFCISSSLQKIASYQSCLGCWSPQFL
jgi:hypothetical protein